MKLSTYTAEVLEIQEPGDRLDPIRVIFRPVPHATYSQGEVIVTCWDRTWTSGDRAWKTWFGNMGDVNDTTLQDFIRTCNPGYLANRLAESAGSKVDGKRRARDEEYLLKIVTVIQASLKQQHDAGLADAKAKATGEAMAAIPPPAHKAGLTAAVRNLQVGEWVEVPRAWEKAVTSTAQRLGITLSARRLGKVDTTTIYRDADPAPAAEERAA